VKKIYPRLLPALLLISCGKAEEPKAEEQNQKTEAAPDTPAPEKQDISTGALIELDPGIEGYQDAVDLAKAAFDAGPSPVSRKSLAEAHIAFADYLTYDSPVTPRQGKYRRALLEYRRALKLLPDNMHAQRETRQIEDIYREMNRPVPDDEL